MNKWKEFCNSAPRTGANATQALKITKVGNVRTVGEGDNKKEMITVSGVTEDGKEHKRLLIPTDDKLGFNSKTFVLIDGRISTTGNSYASPAYNWNIEEVMHEVGDIKVGVGG